MMWSKANGDMEQRSVLEQTTPSGTKKTWFNYRWMRYFFTEDVSPDNRRIIELQRRAVWIAVAFILQALNEIDHNWYIPYLMSFGSLIPLALMLGSFIAMWMALRPASSRLNGIEAEEKNQPRQWQRIVLLLTLILSLFGLGVLGWSMILSFSAPRFTNDGTSLDTNAAILLLEGRNPYVDSNMLDLARKFPIQPDWTTPLRTGQLADRLQYPTIAELQSVLDTDMKAGTAPEFESKVSYPVLSFLTLVPFALFKNYNVLPFYVLSYLVLVAVAWKVSRPELRPWVLLLSMANIPMWSSTVGGNLDVFSTLLIVMVWLLRDKRWASSVFLGLALASKQTAWFFIPFYAIMVYRQYGFKEAIYRLLIAGGLGLAINLPFILWDAHAWLAGIMAPMADPMFPLGVGMINLSITHLLPFFPSWVYAGLEAGAMMVSLAWYWRISRERPEAAMLFAVVPLFFAWRSLPSYFYCAAYPIFILISNKGTPDWFPARSHSTAKVRKPTQKLRLSPSPMGL